MSTTSATNAWTRLADTSDNSNEGGDVQYLEVSGVKYVYALLGNSNRFRRYAVVGDSWTNMVNTPASVKKGGALATDGTYIYALQGDTKKGFWRCNATTDAVAGACSGAGGSWTALANTPQNIGWGGSLTRLGNYLYATQGDGKKGFFRCNFTTTGTAGSCNTSWSVLASAPGNMADGGSTTTNGTYIYAAARQDKGVLALRPRHQYLGQPAVGQLHAATSGRVARWRMTPAPRRWATSAPPSLRPAWCRPPTRSRSP